MIPFTQSRRRSGSQRSNTTPSLVLNFALDKTLDPRITFTRASSGTYFDASGVLQTATTDEPRFDHNPVTGECLGVYIEGAATNLLTYSEDFSNAAWSKIEATVTPSAKVAPDGAMTADKLVASASAGGHFVFQTVSAVGDRCLSCFMEKGEYDYGHLVVFGYGDKATFNLATGEVVSISGNVTSATIENIGNGIYRCTAYSSHVPTLYQWLIVGSPATNPEFTGDGTSGIYIWGAQLETGSRASSYIKTEASTVTRAADSASMTGTNFSQWFNASEGTFVADMSVNSAAGTAFLFVAGNAAADNALYMTRATGNEIIQGESFITPTNVSLPTIAVSSGEFFKTAYAYKANDYAVSTDASALATNTSLLVPAGIDRLGIGYLYAGASGHINGTIKRLTYYPRRLPNAQLQVITA